MKIGEPRLFLKSGLSHELVNCLNRDESFLYQQKAESVDVRTECSFDFRDVWFAPRKNRDWPVLDRLLIADSRACLWKRYRVLVAETEHPVPRTATASVNAVHTEVVRVYDLRYKVEEVLVPVAVVGIEPVQQAEKSMPISCP